MLPSSDEAIKELSCDSNDSPMRVVHSIVGPYPYLRQMRETNICERRFSI